MVFEFLTLIQNMTGIFLEIFVQVFTNILKVRLTLKIFQALSGFKSFIYLYPNYFPSDKSCTGIGFVIRYFLELTWIRSYLLESASWSQISAGKFELAYREFI